ncbi:hypothetical protein KY289_024178 [Solanum tuberosum]|nr:hypothetical protein KY289_024178 [Solanum tuberosum]
MTDEEWKFEHLQVWGYITQWIEDNVRNHIMNETNAKSLWDKLETLYASKTGNSFLDQLSGMNVKFDEEIQRLWLLNTLSDSWETLRVSLTNFAPCGAVTMEYAKSGVLNE